MLARQRQRYRQRALMGRRHHRKARVGVMAQQMIDIDPVAIDRHIVQVGRDPLQQLLPEKVAGILKQHLVARLRQHRQNQPQVGAVAAGDKDLLRLTVEPARNVEVAGDRLAQRRVAHHRRH